MKKPRLSPMIVLTSLFIIFLSVFFVIRNSRLEPVHISAISRTAENITAPDVASCNSLVNMNTASMEELCTLPGIGETLAQRLIDYRTEHGTFQKVEELLCVEGIGAGKLSAILDYITIGGN